MRNRYGINVMHLLKMIPIAEISRKKITKFRHVKYFEVEEFCLSVSKLETNKCEYQIVVVDIL